jgi:hypothetical protein
MTPILIVRSSSHVRAVHQRASVGTHRDILDHEIARRQQPRLSSLDVDFV